MAKDYATDGAVIGAATMAILGQFPPFTVLPEEGLTVPLGLVLGGIIGSMIKK